MRSTKDIHKMGELETGSDVEAPEVPLTFKELFISVLAAALGVQSGRNRARDFERGKPLHFILLGIIFTAIFVVSVVAVVNLVISSFA